MVVAACWSKDSDPVLENFLPYNTFDVYFINQQRNALFEFFVYLSNEIVIVRFSHSPLRFVVSKRIYNLPFSYRTENHFYVVEFNIFFDQLSPFSICFLF
jgi:hypothetical protein